MKTEKKIIPYKNSADEKKLQVAQMFNNIAHKYDFLNHFLSFNIDKIWRKKAINKLKTEKPRKILDIATGTGDLAIQCHKIIKPDQIIGIDISTGMLEVGKQKIEKKGLQQKIQLQEGDSENLKFADNTFDAATVAFGVRNFENLEKGLAEIHRVLEPKGKFVVLEFSKPEAFPVKQAYNFYFKNILPLLGKIFSKDNSAYAYLPESVDNFPYGKKFIMKLEKAGFENISYQKLSFGIAAVYTATKQ